MGTLDYAAKVGKKNRGSLEYRVTREEEFLYNASRGVDSIDPYIGAGTTLLMATDNELLAGIGIVANVAETVLFKLPLLTKYYQTTKDVKGTALLAAKTCLTTFAPNLAILKVLPAHSWSVKNYLSKPYVTRQRKKRRQKSF